MRLFLADLAALWAVVLTVAVLGMLLGMIPR